MHVLPLAVAEQKDGPRGQLPGTLPEQEERKTKQKKKNMLKKKYKRAEGDNLGPRKRRDIKAPGGLNSKSIGVTRSVTATKQIRESEVLGRKMLASM